MKILTWCIPTPPATLCRPIPRRTSSSEIPHPTSPAQNILIFLLSKIRTSVLSIVRTARVRISQGTRNCSPLYNVHTQQSGSAGCREEKNFLSLTRINHGIFGHLSRSLVTIPTELSLLSGIYRHQLKNSNLGGKKFKNSKYVGFKKFEANVRSQNAKFYSKS